MSTAPTTALATFAAAAAVQDSSLRAGARLPSGSGFSQTAARAGADWPALPVGSVTYGGHNTGSKNNIDQIFKVTLEEITSINDAAPTVAVPPAFALQASPGGGVERFTGGIGADGPAGSSERVPDVPSGAAENESAGISGASLPPDGKTLPGGAGAAAGLPQAFGATALLIGGLTTSGDAAATGSTAVLAAVDGASAPNAGTPIAPAVAAALTHDLQAGRSTPARAPLDSGMQTAAEHTGQSARTDGAEQAAGLAAAHVATEKFAGQPAAHNAAEKSAAQPAAHFAAGKTTAQLTPQSAVAKSAGASAPTVTPQAEVAPAGALPADPARQSALQQSALFVPDGDAGVTFTGDRRMHADGSGRHVRATGGRDGAAASAAVRLETGRGDRPDGIALPGAAPADAESAVRAAAPDATGGSPAAHPVTAAEPMHRSGVASSNTVAQPATGGEAQARVHTAVNTQLGEQLIAMAAHGQQSARLQLHPAELGALDIRVAIHDDGATVSISAQHAHAREAIEAGLPRLRELFSSQGMNLLDVDVSAHSGGSGKGSNGTAWHYDPLPAAGVPSQPALVDNAWTPPLAAPGARLLDLLV